LKHLYQEYSLSYVHTFKNIKIPNKNEKEVLPVIPFYAMVVFWD